MIIAAHRSGFFLLQFDFCLIRLGKHITFLLLSLSLSVYFTKIGIDRTIFCCIVFNQVSHEFEEIIFPSFVVLFVNVSSSSSSSFISISMNLLLVTLQSSLFRAPDNFLCVCVSLLFGFSFLRFLFFFFHAPNEFWSLYHCVYINYLQHRFYFQSVITSKSNTKRYSKCFSCETVRALCFFLSLSNFCFPFPCMATSYQLEILIYFIKFHVN